ncbi:hypothetical protein SLE2022_376550 [Rubroshorea leprosula]
MLVSNDATNSNKTRISNCRYIDVDLNPTSERFLPLNQSDRFIMERMDMNRFGSTKLKDLFLVQTKQPICAKISKLIKLPIPKELEILQAKGKKVPQGIGILGA